MALNMQVEVTSGITTTEIPDDIAKDLQEAYDTLSRLPVNRQISVDFPDAKEARLFARQAKAWSAANGLMFRRLGKAKDNPTRVSFRIYKPKP